MKKIYILLFSMLCIGGIHAQVGINTTSPTTTLDIHGKSPSTKVEGMLIPRFTGDEIFSMPIETIETNDNVSLEANLVYATSAAASTNQTGRGVNLTGKGFYYWDGDKWVTIMNSTVNNIWAQVKPMNFVYGDENDYPEGLTAFVAPKMTDGIKLLTVNFKDPGDLTIENNPLNVIMWDNTTKKVLIPAQLLGYSIGITVSLKYEGENANSSASRIVAYTGNATSNATTGIYTSGGIKIKDLFFKRNPVATNNTYVRDELVMNPIIVTQDIITHGLKIFIGSVTSQAQAFYEPVLTVNYGLVNTTL